MRSNVHSVGKLYQPELVNRAFEDPIPGMTTLRDAAHHIQKRPKAEQELRHRQAAEEILIMAAEGGQQS